MTPTPLKKRPNLRNNQRAKLRNEKRTRDGKTAEYAAEQKSDEPRKTSRSGSGAKNGCRAVAWRMI